ncbi:MAG: MerR family transcriptional regulator [Rikenellaceae bacterium]|nr:MerR family transcriptional regulator [Rikenellaceae bacterium]
MAKKLFYSMGEVAEMFDVKPSLLRHWEAKFDILRPHKNKKGNRMFTPEDVENLKLIYHLVKERGMTLAGAAQYLKNGITDTMRRDMELLDRLQRIRAELVEVREQLKDVPDGYTVVEVAQVEPEEEVAIEVAPAEPKMPEIATAIEEEIEELCKPTEEIDEDDVEVEELVEIIYSDEEVEEEAEEEPTEESVEEPAKEEEPKNDTPEEEPTDNTPRPRGAKAGRRSKKQEPKLFEVKPEKQRPIAPFFDQTLF